MKCPYKTGDRKCVHKATAPMKTKRKRLCGYSKQEQCELYLEWFEIVKSCERAGNAKLGYPEPEGEDDN